MALKVKDVAKLINLSEASVRRLISQGKIPAYRLNREYRFSREEIDDWLMQQKINSPMREMNKRSLKEESHFGNMQFCLLRSLSRGDVLKNIQGDNKKEIFHSTMQWMTDHYDLDAEVLCDLFMDRERMMPTALNNGIGVPHARDFRLNTHHDVIVVVYPNKPLDYGALDGCPVYVLFFIFASEDSNHLHLLAKLAHLCAQEKARKFFLTQPSKENLLNYVKEWESNLVASPA